MTLLERLQVPQDELDAFAVRNRIKEISVFGSAARGELAPGSDVDLLVTFDSSAAWDLFDYVAMRDELEAMFGRPIDLVEQGTVTNPFRLKSIKRDLIPVYASN